MIGSNQLLREQRAFTVIQDGHHGRLVEDSFSTHALQANREHLCLFGDRVIQNAYVHTHLLAPRVKDEGLVETCVIGSTCRGIITAWSLGMYTGGLLIAVTSEVVTRTVTPSLWRSPLRLTQIVTAVFNPSLTVYS